MVAVDTDKEANRLFPSIQLRALGMLKGSQMPLHPPVNDIDSVWSKHERYAVDQSLKYSSVGGPATVKKSLEPFLKQTQVEEIMTVSHIHDHIARLRSYEILSSL